MKKCINVLVVDDEEIMRNLFTDILQDEGHKVTTVTNGIEALEIVKSQSFDIAFIDVHMPVMDGVKTLQVLREIVPRVAIVMMDSMPSGVLKRFRAEGVVTCIHKPFGIDEVRSVVKEIINREK
ncbi:response regulator [Candidatus Omnitrophota bacterium]